MTSNVQVSVLILFTLTACDTVNHSLNLERLFVSFTSKIPHTLSWFCCYLHLFCWILYLFPTSKSWSTPPSVFRTPLYSYSFLPSFHLAPRHQIPSVHSLIFQLSSFPDLHIYNFYLTFTQGISNLACPKPNLKCLSPNLLSFLSKWQQCSLSCLNQNL